MKLDGFPELIHENDATDDTRQGKSGDASSPRKGNGGKGETRRGSGSPQKSIGKGLVPPRNSPKEVQASSPPVSIQTQHGGKEKETPPPSQGGWTTVARMADRAKPGNVNIGRSSPKPKKQGALGARAATPPPTTKREAGVIRVEITREADWRERVGMTPKQLIEEIREAAGDWVASQIGSIKMYEGGVLKITPRAQATSLQKEMTWMVDWIPSAVPSTLKWKEVVVHGVPYDGSADMVLEQLWEQNDDALQDCQLGACAWLGRPEQLRKKAALRIKLDSAKKVNDLIINGVFLEYAHLKVSRYWSDGPFRRRTRNPYFSLPEEAEGPEDRMEEDDDSFRDSLSSSSSPPPTPSPEPPLREDSTAAQGGLEALESSGETSTSSESRSQKRLREPSPSGEGEAPKRGRPVGAVGLSRFRFEKLQGRNPFAIAKGQIEGGKPQSLGTQVPAT